jgi:hypothetical protein
MLAKISGYSVEIGVNSILIGIGTSITTLVIG